MFKKLVASGPRRRAGASATTIIVSLAVHAVLVAGAVYASVAAPQEAEREEELVTFVEIPEPVAPEPEADPPPPPVVQPAATPPPPRGFQELVPPIEPPSVIPDVDNSLPAVNPDDFSGVGQAGGVAEGVEDGVPQDIAAVDSVHHAYEVAVLSRQPELRNLNQVRGYMERNYPRTLQDAGIGGSVTLEFIVEANGTVNPASVRVLDASHQQFERVSAEVVERFRFRPGLYGDQEVRVLVRMPITWQPRR